MLCIVFGLALTPVMAQRKFSPAVLNQDLWDKVDFTSPEECSGDPKDCAVRMLGALKIDVTGSPMFSVYRLSEIDGKSVTVVFVS